LNTSLVHQLIANALASTHLIERRFAEARPPADLRRLVLINASNAASSCWCCDGPLQLGRDLLTLASVETKKPTHRISPN